MPEQQITAFIARVKADPQLQIKVKAAFVDADFDRLEAIAAESGLEISKDDLLQLQPPTEQEIEEGVVGPYTTHPFTTCSTRIGCP